MNDLAIDGAVVDGEPMFCHQFFDVPITERIGQIPTYALQDHVVLKEK